MNITEANVTSRLLPLAETNASATIVANAMRAIADLGGVLDNVSVSVNRIPSSPNSVLPGWRQSMTAVLTNMYVICGLSLLLFCPMRLST
ncbi:hypothetical protein B0H63DRAFT_489525 [Podospora didyma]|uniref:Uncharacterized protein n=1 Tax=Podospora didyma TaxID=330526 RepID=A0AAE0K0X5_9PEZI|nr:hypothetical protein B0H63DRAFT_489525 [Podospora didyma]